VRVAHRTAGLVTRRWVWLQPSNIMQPYAHSRLLVTHGGGLYVSLSPTRNHIYRSSVIPPSYQHSLDCCNNSRRCACYSGPGQTYLFQKTSISFRSSSHHSTRPLAISCRLERRPLAKAKFLKLHSRGLNNRVFHLLQCRTGCTGHYRIPTNVAVTATKFASMGSITRPQSTVAVPAVSATRT
jgi:hypothetical protein